MSWSLSASGHVPPSVPAGPSADPNAPLAQPQSQFDVESELYSALSAILSNPKYGASTSSFGGQHVSGSPHQPDTAG